MAAEEVGPWVGGPSLLADEWMLVLVIGLPLLSLVEWQLDALCSTRLRLLAACEPLLPLFAWQGNLARKPPEQPSRRVSAYVRRASSRARLHEQARHHPRPEVTSCEEQSVVRRSSRRTSFQEAVGVVYLDADKVEEAALKQSVETAGATAMSNRVLTPRFESRANSSESAKLPAVSRYVRKKGYLTNEGKRRQAAAKQLQQEPPSAAPDASANTSTQEPPSATPDASANASTQRGAFLGGFSPAALRLSVSKLGRRETNAGLLRTRASRGSIGGTMSRLIGSRPSLSNG